MRKRDKAMASEDAVAFLEGRQVGRLAMAMEDQPYIVPLNYVYLDGRIYFHCAREGKKIDYFTKNPKVCFEVDEQISIRRSERACDWGTRYRSVIVYGTIRLLKDEDRKLEVMKKLLEKYAGGAEHPSIHKSSLANVEVAEIKIDLITGKQDLK